MASRSTSSPRSEGDVIRRDILFRRIKIATVLLVILAAIGFSVKPAYHAYREQRIEKNLEAAREAARLEDWPTARDKARSVLIARNGDSEAYRIWAKALAENGEPTAYIAAIHLFVKPESSTDDRVEALHTLALQAPQAITLGAYLYLLKEEKELAESADIRAAIAPLFILRKQAALVEKGLREKLGESPSPRVRLELIRAICAAPTPERVVEARGHLAALIAANAGKQALEALLLLGNTPGGLAPGKPLPDLPTWVGRQPRAETIHHLLAMHPGLDTAGSSADRLFQEAIDRFSSVDPGVLGTWLIRHNRSEQALKLLEEPAKVRSDAYLARLHALLGLERNDELKKALAEPPPVADMVEVEIVRAVLAKRRGDDSESSAAWTRALNEAAYDSSRNRFLLIAQTAEAQGAKSVAEDAWIAAIRTGWGQLPLFSDMGPLLASLGSQGRSEDLLAIFQTLIRFEPDNPLLINNYLYLGLLHDVVSPATAIPSLTKLLASNPEMEELNSALMLAHLLDGKPEEALKRVTALRKSERIAPMMKDALEGTAREMTGETNPERDLLATVEWRSFMPQERLVFRNLKQQDVENPTQPLPILPEDRQAENPEEVPAWRKAIERFEEERKQDVLPALPSPDTAGQSPPPLRPIKAEQ